MSRPLSSLRIIGRYPPCNRRQKAGLAHGRSGCFAEEQNPLLMPGIERYRQGHKTVSLDVMSSVVVQTAAQQNLHFFCHDCCHIELCC